MFSIVIGFPRIQDAIAIRNVLVKNGYHVSEPCSLGAQIINRVNELDEGIVVCGYRFSDMFYGELNEYLPKGFEMLLVASVEKLNLCRDNDIVCLQMPVKTLDLLNTLQIMTYQYQQRKKKEREKPKTRSQKDKDIINRAKCIIMDRNNMTEEEAYRYLQKNSMDSGTNLVEIAEMILRLYLG